MRNAASVTRPILRWYGGKFAIRNWIVSNLPPHRVYVEPYGGAGSVLLAKPRSFGEVYNDIDHAVVRLFRVLRDREQAERLIALLHLTPFSREEFELAQAQDLALVSDPIEASRLLIVRSFQGHGADSASGAWNTGWRGNSWGSNRSAPQDWLNYPEPLRAVCGRLRGVELEHGEAIPCMVRHDGPDSLHYVDPPYVQSTRSRARGYRHELDERQHRELAEVLHSLAGAVVLSGYNSPLYEQLFEGWHRVQRAALADGSRPRTEVLWSNRPFHRLLEHAATGESPPG